MNDCRLTIEVKQGEVLIQAEHMSLVELATLCGYLEELAGTEAAARGMRLDEVKDRMLDIHLAAMQSLAERLKKEGGNRESHEERL